MILSGCSYAMNDGVWLKQVNVTNLGSVLIAANSTITLQLTLLNPLYSRDFDSNGIEFYVVSSADNYVAMGKISLE